MKKNIMAAITLGFIAAAAAKGLLGAAIAGGATAVIKNLMDKNNNNSFAQKFQLFINNLNPFKPNLGSPLDTNKNGVIDDSEVGKKEESTPATPPQPTKPNTPQNPNSGQQPGIPGGVVDKTDENVDTPIFGSSTLEEFKGLLEQEKAYREEQQKHLEERQDSAYQRAVEDLRRAGINPNLLGSINPADSDAGITTSMNLNSSELLTRLETYSEELQQFIENNFKGDENEKDRFTDLFTRWGQTLILTYLTGFKG